MDNNGKRNGVGGDFPGSSGANGELKFVFVPPALADEAWPFVLEAIERARAHSTSTWSPQDVLREIKAGAAHLLFTARDAIISVLVMRFLEKFDGNKEARIWIFCASEDFYDYFDKLEDYAKYYGANELTFSSPRKGWAKVAPKLGFEVAETLYRKRLI